MKMILKIIVLGLLLSTSAFSANKNVGTGEVTLSYSNVEYFIKYIKGSYSQKPSTYWITVDGQDPYWWTCSEGSCQARSTEIEECETYYKKECRLFARRRTIVWENGINPGKGKASTIKSKLSEAEIRAKLTELGFLGGSTSSTTTTTPKITKKKNENKGNTVEQLEALATLFKAGSLTKEEYDKAKKKVLSD
jgi:hypothetical protein